MNNTSARLTSCVGTAGLQALLPLLQMISIIVTIDLYVPGADPILAREGTALAQEFAVCGRAQRRIIIATIQALATFILGPFFA